MAPLPQLTPGTLFARDFRVLRHLSAGGMGAVYVVEQISTQRQRALKIMLPDLVREPKARERFMQEATVGARIRSDHVVEVVGAGVDEASGTPWMAMELLEGENLAETMSRRGALPPAEVMEIFRQLCHALTAAHRVGLVHRDLKPENIFMATARREGVAFTVKILDFGIAKVVGESRTSAAATAAIGSPLWMAPEQAEQGMIRPATDVWALGLIAYHLLTGVYYWRSANTEDFVLAALLKEVYMDPLEPASQRAAAYGRAHLLPDGFDAWFARTVVRDPLQRYPDAYEALAALLPVLGVAAGMAPNVPTWPGSPSQGPLVSTPPAPPAAAIATPLGYPAAPNTAGGPPGPAYGTMAWNPHATPGGLPPSTAWAPASPSTASSATSATNATRAVAIVVMMGAVTVAMGVVGMTYALLKGRSNGGGGGDGGALPSVVRPVFRGPQCRGTGTRRDIQGIARATSLAAGRFHTCAALADGSARCWGWNQLGQIGDGTSEDQYLPASVAGLAGVLQVSAGMSNSCAVVQGGAVYCWGLGERGPRYAPWRVEGIEGATQVSVGNQHMCARRVDGAVLCWGLNGSGQLGDGTDDSRYRAREVVGLSGVAQVAAGDGHTCALLVDGSVACWGRQENGALGNGHRAREPLLRPIRVPGLDTAVQVVAGENHTCALLRDGTVRCWGSNDTGQLGSGAEGGSAVPVAVIGLSNVARVAAGYHHTCALQSSGALWCWGENFTCQLGVGPLTGPNRPVRVEAPGPLVEVSAGGNHTCGRTAGGTVRCWGFNVYGQLGNGSASRTVDFEQGG